MAADAQDLAAVVADLASEIDSLADLLHAADDGAWDAATPAAGWAVRDQVVHLAQGDELASLAIRDPDGFAGELTRLLADLDAVAERTTQEAAAAPGPALLDRWCRAARTTVEALRAHAPSERIGWVTGPISARSFATARLMETWAHGIDIATALGVEPTATDRIRHVADLGVRTRRFSFANRGLPEPDEPYVALTAPSGAEWSWGEPSAAEAVRGPAVDFCLVVTQRLHVADTRLAAAGAGVSRWLEIAQCFAGPPTDGPPPSSPAIC